MSRLDELMEMRCRIDLEIQEEREQLWKMARLRDDVESLLEQYSAPTGAAITAAARRFGVSEVELVDPDMRGRNVTEARHVAAWILHHSGLSYSATARAIGYRDHTTVIYGVRRVRDDARLGSIADQLAQDLRAQLQAAAS